LRCDKIVNILHMVAGALQDDPGTRQRSP